MESNDDGIVELPPAEEVQPVEIVQVEKQELDSLKSEVSGLRDDLRVMAVQDDEQVQEVTEQVITIGETQWTALQEAFAFQRSAFQLVDFLLLCVLVMVAANFGSKLWSSFAEGWRH